MKRNQTRTCKKSAEQHQLDQAKLDSALEKVEALLPRISPETQAKRNPDQYRGGERALKMTDRISDRHLKPVHRKVLSRLIMSEGLWVDANALGYMNNPNDYNDMTDALDLTDQLNATLHHIQHYLQGSEYRLEKMRIGRRIGKVRLQKVS